MKRRVYISLCATGMLSVLLAVILILWSFYGFYTREVKAEIHRQGIVIAQSLTEMQDDEERLYYLKQISNQAIGTRLTLISEDGTVLFDSNSNPGKMENHLSRPEVKQAIEAGEGETTRYSSTSNISTYYYAKLTEEGDVIRVAKQTKSVRQVFLNTIPIVLGIMILLFTLCAWVSSRLSKRLIDSIDNISRNLDDVSSWNYYDELSPFVQKIMQQQSQIQEQLEKQKELENIRREFTSNISHELKTPLTSISGFAEMIGNGMAEPGDVKAFSQKISREASRLVKLIDDIIGLSRIEESEQKAAEADKEEICLYDLSQEVLSFLAFQASQNNIDLRVFGNPNLYIVGNFDMIEQALVNLCENAVKYNRKDGKVYVILTEGENGMVSIAVKDTGIGIPKEHHERIFERFYRVDKSRSKQIGGTGLGLSIVKHVVELHGGQLHIESVPDEGTTITVMLPGKVVKAD